MIETGAESQISYHHHDRYSGTKKWNPKMDTSIFIAEQQQTVSHKNIIRRWNRLSRLQRSLVYAFLLITITVLILLYSSKLSTDINKDEIKKVVKVS
ncbi:unnamed protein product [Diatraea saccharalis]|uniref:Uncharacterized protein n=1 Tax=Diatraea saccharalis TaxID=40085 RepID=A0A9N9MZJ8_9NEOP|nr:unnamed protein product [Diatraea saccharalis]